MRLVNGLFARALLFLTVVGMGAVANAQRYADIVFVVDESGSMAGEHAWISTMVMQLESALVAAQVGDQGGFGNRYGLVGFGGGGGAHPVGGHSHLVGGGQFGTAAQLAAAAGGLVTTGATEDGYSGLDVALNYTFRANAAVNFILITDEDRDVFNNTLNFSNILARMTNLEALLNVVVNNQFRTNANQTALGLTSDLDWYRANGAGGFTTGPNGVIGTGAGTTNANYVQLAFATGGGAWDLNQLRLGGLTSQSFTAAFVDLKVEEIVRQTIPAPGAAIAFGLGLIGARRRRNKR